MRLSSTRVTAIAAAAVAALSVSGLFAAQPGREGVYYGAASDPSITALIAANRDALGPELSPYANGFSSLAGISAINATASLSGSELVITTTTPVVARGEVPISGLVAGAQYLIELRAYRGTQGNQQTIRTSTALIINTVAITATSAPGQVIAIPTYAVAESGVIRLYSSDASGAAGDELRVASISIKAIADRTKLIGFADPSGTVPLLSVHQSDRGFGLLLDRSKGLVRGANTFADANVTFVGGSSRVSPGVYRLYTADGSYSIVSGPAFSVTIGKWYEVEFTVDSVTTPGNGLQIEAAETVPTIPSTVGRKSVVVKATVGTLGIKRASTAMDVQVSNISVRELPGNHYVQATATARGEITARVNLAPSSGDLSLWQQNGTMPVTVAPTGSPKEGQVSTTTGNSGTRYFSFSAPAGCVYIDTRHIKPVNPGLQQRVYRDGPASGAQYADVVPSTGVVTTNTPGLTCVCTPLAGGWYRLVTTFPPTTAAGTLAFHVHPLQNETLQTADVDVRFGDDFIPSIPTFQSAGGSVATDYDSVGFPVRWRGQTDDFGKTRINPNGATKALVVWAGQKMSDAAVGVVFESSASSGINDGTLALFAPNTAGQPRYMLRSRGTATVEAQDSTHPAPGRDVILAQTSIATDVVALYVDGALAAQSTDDQGTGAYTEQDVFFWSRAGVASFFNGYASTLPLLMFMQPGDPGPSTSQIAQLNKVYAKAGGVTL